MESNRHNIALRSGRWRQRGSRAGLAILLVACLSVPWLGCTAQKRYQVLSVFFDGVPNPKNTSSGPSDVPNAAMAKLRAGHAPLAYQHKPFVEGNCAACHPADKQIDVAHVKQSCLSCHPKVEQQYPVMHAPVTTGDCLWCHKAHESAEPKLLIASSPKLCRQCHDLRGLSAFPPEHLDSERNCLDCHLGHGGATAKYLKPNVPSTTLPTSGGPS